MKMLVEVSNIIAVAPLQHSWSKRSNTSQRNQILSERLKSTRSVNRIGAQHRVRSDRLEHGVRCEHQSIARANQTYRSRCMPGRVNDSQALVLEQYLVFILQLFYLRERISEAAKLLITRFHLINRFFGDAC